MALVFALGIAGCGGAPCPEPPAAAASPQAGPADGQGSEAAAPAEAENRPAPTADGVDPGRERPPEVERFRVPVRGDRPTKGPDDALVTIVALSDFECPFCKRAAPTLERLARTYGHDVRIVWRNHPLPFHKRARPAAIAAMEAYEQGGDRAFWRMHDRIFANQRQLSDADLLRYGREIGLDTGDLQRALDREEHVDAIEADVALAARLGVRGTPGFFINGRLLMGAQPYAEFERIVEDELAGARRLVREGVHRSQLYAHLMKDAIEKREPPQPRRRARRPDPDAIYRVPVDDEPSKGREGALVTIVEISDFQCPFCKRVQPTLQRVLDEYGNDVRLVWMNNPLPFHQQAMPAAEAALEAHDQGGDAMFWRMHDLLFEHQKELSEDTILRLAAQAGMDMDALERALQTHEHRATIDEQRKLAERLGATGTPSFFINGQFLRGAQPYAAFEKVVAAQLERARGLLRQGVPRGRLYEKLIEDGATAPQLVDGDEPPAARREVYDVDFPEDTPRRGPADAPVQIHAFIDFECPYCKRIQDTYRRLREAYPDRVAIHFHHYPLPFHQKARPAHRAAIEVRKQGGDGKFWQYHDLLFENQEDLERQDLIRYARQVGGIHIGRLRRALVQERHDDVIDADMRAVQESGARIGTPSSFINGRLLQGAQPYGRMEAAVKRALEEH